jgi:arylsulfate sulfotransferase
MFKGKTGKRSILSIFILALILSAGYAMRIFTPVDKPIEEEPVVENPNADLYLQINEIEKTLSKQQTVDENIISELGSGNYTFDNPLIIVDPYNSSPLTAIIVFKTEIPVQIKIRIVGVDQNTDINYLITNSETEHIIPIYGLYAGTLNHIILTSIGNDGESIEKEFLVQTEPLPESLASNVFNIFEGVSPVTPGLTFSYGNGYNNQMKTAFDKSGNYRWFLNKVYLWPCNFNSGISLFVSFGSDIGNVFIIEMNYLGKYLNVYYSPFGAHHDIEVMDDHIIVAGTNNYPNTIEDFIYEINRASGQITKKIDYKNVLLRTRIYGVFYSNLDWMHINSVTEYDESIIVSSNYQSTIIRNKWDGEIEWILADPSRYSNKYIPYILKPIGQNFEYPYNQHAVEVLPDTDNNPNTLDIIVFDNGTSRNDINEELQRKLLSKAMIEPPLYSRMVVYRIDEKNMTVRQLWEYGSQRSDLFATYMGDADLLENGNYLGVFVVTNSLDENTNKHTVYLEVNPQGEIVSEIIGTSTNAENYYEDYRAERFNIYNSKSIDMQIGLRGNNLIPEDLLQEVHSYISSIGELK